MTKEELNKIFEDIESNWKGDNALQGCNIIAKYIRDGDIIQGAEHDIIYSADIDHLLEAGLTKADAIKLAELNWSIQDDYFTCYV